MACQAVTNGFKCEKGKIITLTSPNDPSNPLTSHNWKIDGVQESTAAQFQKTYTVPGTHTVVHSGSNACAGTCSKSTQLDIVDVITPPATTAAAPSGVSPLIAVGVVVVLGFLGIVMFKKK